MFLGGCALEAVSLLWRNEYKEEEEESTEEEKMIESTENFNVNTTIVYTQSGRRATQIQFKVALNRMSISWTW